MCAQIFPLPCSGDLKCSSGDCLSLFEEAAMEVTVAFGENRELCRGVGVCVGDDETFGIESSITW